MLKNRAYSIAEMQELLKSEGKQNIDRKLQRYGIDFSVSGHGKSVVYTINHIPDPFKVYAIVKLGIPAQANFINIRNLYYFLLCAEGFAELPLIEMERIMADNGTPLPRQTITKWINYLEHIDYITFSTENMKYYVIRKTPTGKKEYREIDADTYKKGWAIYFNWRDKEGSGNAYARMFNTIGGHPYKKREIVENAVFQEEIDELIEVINESFLENPML